MVLSHQFLGQLEPKLQEAFAANTAIKFAGGVSAKDARSLAPMLYCQPELIEAQPKASFAAHVRGQTKSAVPLRFPLGFMETLPKMDKAEQQALRQRMRDLYAVHYSEFGKVGEQDADGIDEVSVAASDAPPPKPPPGHIDTDAGETW